jgi:hypothetical protein
MKLDAGKWELLLQEAFQVFFHRRWLSANQANAIKKQSVANRSLVTSCRMFLDDPSLILKPYDVQSRVSQDSFRMFVCAIGGQEAEITQSNIADLSLLCSEFEFDALLPSIDEWHSAHPPIDYAAVLRELGAARDRILTQDGSISDLDRRAEDVDAAITDLRRLVSQQQAALDAGQRQAGLGRSEIGPLKAAVAPLNADLDHKWLRPRNGIPRIGLTGPSRALYLQCYNVTRRCKPSMHRHLVIPGAVEGSEIS